MEKVDASDLCGSAREASIQGAWFRLSFFFPAKNPALNLLYFCSIVT